MVQKKKVVVPVWVNRIRTVKTGTTRISGAGGRAIIGDCCNGETRLRTLRKAPARKR